MFLVFNKQKIMSYTIALSTIVILFLMAGILMKGDEQTVLTSANINNNLPIYSVETEEQKVALTINCAWNADDIGTILDTLSKYNVKVTFFMVGDWVDKYRRCSKEDI